MDTYFDAWTMKHLDAWLDHYVDGDDCREAVKAAMLTEAADDPEYWSAQSWSHLFDYAKCDRIISTLR